MNKTNGCDTAVYKSTVDKWIITELLFVELIKHIQVVLNILSCSEL